MTRYPSAPPRRRAGAPAAARSLAPIAVAIAAAIAALAAAREARGQGDDLLLPDLVVRRADLFDYRVVSNLVPGRTHLRFTNGTANVGEGELYLYGLLPGNPDGTQDVMQRIPRREGGHEERLAGRFVFHGEHNHIHIENWAIYRLRTVLAGDGVGPVIARSEKTSFCIVDLQPHDRTLPNFATRPRFVSCNATVQGLSVGWADIYDRTVPGQAIDITGLPDGQYWLESVVDPENLILEIDDFNNIARIQLTIGDPNLVDPDTYEPNDGPADLDDRPPAGPNSPNLGPCNPKRVIDGLNLHVIGNEDWFKFYSNSAGADGDFVRIDFEHALGNLDLELLDASLAEVGSSRTDGDFENIPLAELPAGWYHVRVLGRDNTVNDDYRLTINPPANDSPGIDVIDPPPGDTRKIHGSEIYRVSWSVQDPDGDPTWVSVYLNEAPVLDGTEHGISTARNVDGELGYALINTAEFEHGTYWVYCQVTDGGTTRGDWSAGTVSLIELAAECRVFPGTDGDCNANGSLDSCEIEEGIRQDCDGDGALDECQIAADPALDRDADGDLDACEATPFHRGDANGDGVLDVSDGLRILNWLFVGGLRPDCLEAADVDNDAEVAITDGIAVLFYLFSGGPAPAAPGPPGLPCGIDPDPAGASGDLGCLAFTGCGGGD